MIQNSYSKRRVVLSNLGHGIINLFINAITGLIKDKLWFVVLVLLFAKAVIFASLIPSETANILQLKSAFYSTCPPIIVYLSFNSIFISFAFLFKGRKRLWAIIVLDLLYSAFVVMDLWYYRGFGTFLTLNILKETSNLNNLSSCVYSMTRKIDLIFIPDVIILIAFALFKRKAYKNVKRSIPTFVLVLILCIGLIAEESIRIDVYGKGASNQAVFYRYWRTTQTMSNLSPIGYHIFDVCNFMTDGKGLVLDEKQKKEISDWYNDKQENLPANKYNGMYKGKNLLVIQVESMENFVINQKQDGQEITPTLNKLANNGLYFPDYYEMVNNGTSSDADLMTNTSVYPKREGSTFFDFPENKYNSLPKLLQNIGYSTHAIHPDKGGYWNWMESLRSIGFQQLTDTASFNVDETIGLGISDKSYLRQVEPMIKKQKQPFYSFVVTLTSHSPFNLPENDRELKLSKYLDNSVLGGYFQSVHYTDKYIGEMLDKLDKDGILDNTVVVIYGDHTGVHKYYQDEVNTMNPSEDWWKSGYKNIPLIIYNKGAKPETINTTGGQVDLMPTIAYLMGVDESSYANTVMGRNLLNTKKSFAVLNDKTFLGLSANKKERAEDIKGLDIADKIIRSNYFKNYKTK